MCYNISMIVKGDKMKERTRVVFKMLEGEPIAFLLDVEANPNMVMSYMHVGQHGEASMECYQECPLAEESQYADLKSELESIGYHLIPVTVWHKYFGVF